MPRFTDEQLAAITAKNRELLVSAAAGSGKTAVLVERIAKLVLEGTSLRRMLIVTFTNAAAAEMRQRLTRRLKELMPSDPDTAAQALEDLESCDICTIHGFCRRFLQREFQAAGLDPSCRIARADESTHLFARAARDSLDRLLSEKDEAVRRLTARFSVADIPEMTDALYRFAMSLSRPFDWLRERAAYAAERPVKAGRWYREALAEAGDALRDLLAEAGAYLRLCGEQEDPGKLRDTFEADRSPMLTIRQFLDRGDVRSALTVLPGEWKRRPAFKPADAAQEAWFERWKAARDALKEAFDKTAKTYAPLLADEETLARDMDDAADSVSALVRLTEETHRRFRELKDEARLLDFGDLEQMTFDLLTDPADSAVREAWQGAYDLIFVDECQDNSQIQNDILTALHGPGSRIFYVGDVKQSIYRFRMANPTLFLERVRSFGREEKAASRALFLTRNFRSAAPVLEAANAVFGQAMRAEITEIDYREEDRLRAGRADAPSDRVRVEFSPGKGTAGALRQREQALIAAAMRSVVGSPKPGGGAYRWRDVAVLLPRVAGVAESLTAAMQAAEIPVYFDGADSFFELPEVRALHSILTLIDRPTDEIALLSVMRGAPFDFTDAELAAVRSLAPRRRDRWHRALDAAAARDDALGAKVRSFRETLRRWRDLRGTFSLYDYCWMILEESGILVRMCGRPGAEARLRSMRTLCEKAADYEDNGGTSLAGFLERVADEIDEGDSRSPRELGEDEDMVRVMTMHKSKGLEFPVVICAGLGSEGRTGADTLTVHRDLGFCLPFVDRRLGTRREVFPRTLIASRKARDERAERCRLLYVAMTRARDRLILCAAAPEKDLWREPSGEDRLRRSESMLDWLMEAVYDREGRPDSPFDLRITEDPALEGTAAEREDIRTERWRNDRPGRAFDWETLPRDRASVPKKTSVTSLTAKHVLGDPMPLSDADEEQEEKRFGETIVSPLKLSPLPDAPAWLREEEAVTGAARGTANHRFLSLVSTEAVREADPQDLFAVLQRERARMLAADILSPGEAALIALPRCADFFRSDIGRAMLCAQTVKREWGFNLRLGPGLPMLQGVIDLAFRTPDGWTLVDYKTDRIEDDAAFVRRHEEQLNWYAEALRTITGEPVTALWLWSLSKSRAYGVEMMNVECRM